MPGRGEGGEVTQQEEEAGEGKEPTTGQMAGTSVVVAGGEEDFDAGHDSSRDKTIYLQNMCCII